MKRERERETSFSIRTEGMGRQACTYDLPLLSAHLVLLDSAFGAQPSDLFSETFPVLRWHRDSHFHLGLLHREW